MTLPPDSSTHLRRWRIGSWLVALVMAAAVCHSMLRIPLQPTDSLIPILAAQATPSVADAISGSMGSPGYLRPLRIGQIKLLYDAAGGHYFAVYKGFHIALVVAAFALFVTAIRVRTATDFLAATFALTVFTGIHTFVRTVWEAYPVNSFLEIGVFCLATLVLAQSRGGWLPGLAACVLLAAGALTLESGLLVWVVAAAAWLTGLRGLCGRVVLVMTLLVVAYFVMRFGVLDTGAPGMVERSSGFGTERLEPAEIVARFGSRPYLFYAYNVGSSAFSVLASEPRDGEWRIAAEMQADGTPLEGSVLNLATSIATTALIVMYARRRWPLWRQRRFGAEDQLVVVAIALIGANAAMSFAYTKDDIMSAAGMFYPLAAYIAARDVAQRLPFAGSGRTILVALLLMILAGGWALRSAGVHYQMRLMAFSVRNDWVNVDHWLESQRAMPSTPEGRRLVSELTEDALRRPVINPFFFPYWMARWIR
jgi:hypothetical protein